MSSSLVQDRLPGTNEAGNTLTSSTGSGDVQYQTRMNRKPPKQRLDLGLDPEDVIAGRVRAPAARELIELICAVNPTGRDLAVGETARRYTRKSRLQSILIRHFAEDLAVAPDPHEPGVVSPRQERARGRRSRRRRRGRGRGAGAGSRAPRAPRPRARLDALAERASRWLDTALGEAWPTPAGGF